MLSSIFYARFHSERGPVILRQHPQVASIFAPQRSNGDEHNELTQFSEVSSYIIPPYELCNKPLSVAVNGPIILGFPVSIEDAKYPRNRFTFNVCFVVTGTLDSTSRRAWNRIVSKTAKWFERIELQGDMLSTINEDNDLVLQGAENNADLVSDILQQMFEQLSQYQECCIQVTDAYVLNLRLVVRQHKIRQSAYAWHVPLLIAELPAHEVTTRDIVLEQILPHIDGVNHIKRIAALADVELDLVQGVITTLLEQGFAILLDIFHFRAIYALTEEFSSFISDDALLAECQQYIAQDSTLLGAEDVIALYLALAPAGTVADFCLQHRSQVMLIDVRRFVTYGVIKGFLRRRHRYASLANTTPAVNRPIPPLKKPYEDAVTKFEQAWKEAALSSGWSTPPATLPASVKLRAHRTAEEAKRVEDERLRQDLDGQHCFDEICVKLGMTEKELLSRLDNSELGDITYFTK